MTDYAITTEDRYPAFTTTLGSDADLDSASEVRLYVVYTADDTLVVNEPMTIDDAETGAVSYQFDAGETARVGYHLAEVVVDYGDGTRTYPDSEKEAYTFKFDEQDTPRDADVDPAEAGASVELSKLTMLGDIVDDQDNKVYDYSAGHVPLSVLEQSSLGVTAGDGLTGGGDIGLGGSATLDVVVADIVGAGVEDDGSGNIRLSSSSAGNGLTGGSGNALAIATDGVGTDELDLAITPTWTGQHTFDAGFITGATSNLKGNSLRMDDSGTGGYISTTPSGTEVAIYSRFGGVKAEFASGGKDLVLGGDGLRLNEGSIDRIDSIFFSNGNSELVTRGFGASSITIRDSANAQDLAVFNEGGPVEFPNTGVDIGNNVLFNVDRLEGLPSGIKFTSSASLKTAGGGSNVINILDVANGQNLAVFNEGGPVEFPNTDIGLSNESNLTWDSSDGSETFAIGIDAGDTLHLGTSNIGTASVGRVQIATDSAFGSGEVRVYTDNFRFEGAPLSNVGSIDFGTDRGAITGLDMEVTSTPTAGTEQSYSFDIDGTSVATVYAEADGAGGIQNSEVRTGVADALRFGPDVAEIRNGRGNGFILKFGTQFQFDGWNTIETGGADVDFQNGEIQNTGSISTNNNTFEISTGNTGSADVTIRDSANSQDLAVFNEGGPITFSENLYFDAGGIRIQDNGGSPTGVLSRRFDNTVQIGDINGNLGGTSIMVNGSVGAVWTTNGIETAGGGSDSIAIHDAANGQDLAVFNEGGVLDFKGNEIRNAEIGYQGLDVRSGSDIIFEAYDARAKFTDSSGDATLRWNNSGRALLVDSDTFSNGSFSFYMDPQSGTTEPVFSAPRISMGVWDKDDYYLRSVVSWEDPSTFVGSASAPFHIKPDGGNREPGFLMSPTGGDTNAHIELADASSPSASDIQVHIQANGPSRFSQGIDYDGSVPDNIGTGTTTLHGAWTIFGKNDSTFTAKIDQSDNSVEAQQLKADTITSNGGAGIAFQWEQGFIRQETGNATTISTYNNNSFHLMRDSAGTVQLRGGDFQFHADSNERILTHGGGANSITIRDSANAQDLAVFNEGGTIELPSTSNLSIPSSPTIDLGKTGEIHGLYRVRPGSGGGDKVMFETNGGNPIASARNDGFWKFEADARLNGNTTLYYNQTQGSKTFIDYIGYDSATAGTELSYSFDIDGNSVATVYAEADGAGGVSGSSPSFEVYDRLRSVDGNNTNQGIQIGFDNNPYISAIDNWNSSIDWEEENNRWFFGGGIGVNNWIQTKGGGSDQITIRDSANAQDLAVFNEGGQVEIPNGKLSITGSSFGDALFVAGGDGIFRDNIRMESSNPRITTRGDGTDSITIYDRANSQDLAVFNEGGPVEFPNHEVRLKSTSTDSRGLTFLDGGAIGIYDSAQGEYTEGGMMFKRRGGDNVTEINFFDRDGNTVFGIIPDQYRFTELPVLPSLELGEGAYMHWNQPNDWPLDDGNPVIQAPQNAGSGSIFEVSSYSGALTAGTTREYDITLQNQMLGFYVESDGGGGTENRQIRAYDPITIESGSTLQTAGSGTDTITIFDSANGQDLAVFNEGGDVHVPDTLRVSGGDIQFDSGGGNSWFRFNNTLRMRNANGNNLISESNPDELNLGVSGNPVSVYGSVLEIPNGDLTSGSTGALELDERSSVADAGKVAISRDDTAHGYAMVQDTTNNESCMVYLGGTANVVEIIHHSGGATSFTTTEDNDGTTNIYWDSGNGRYELNNETGGTATYAVEVLKQ